LRCFFPLSLSLRLFLSDSITHSLFVCLSFFFLFLFSLSHALSRARALSLSLSSRCTSVHANACAHGACCKRGMTRVPLFNL
jgi:hypothetical protein